MYDDDIELKECVCESCPKDCYKMPGDDDCAYWDKLESDYLTPPCDKD